MTDSDWQTLDGSEDLSMSFLNHFQFCVGQVSELCTIQHSSVVKAFRAELIQKP